MITADGDTAIILNDADVAAIVQLIAENDGCKEELSDVYSSDSAARVLLTSDSLIISEMRGDSLLFIKTIELCEENKATLTNYYEKIIKKLIRKKGIISVFAYLLIVYAGVLTVLYVVK